MKRLILVLLITLSGVIASFVDAYYGLLLYTWYSFATPLELTYGALEGSRLSLVVAIVVILTTIQQKNKIFVNHFTTHLCLGFVFVCFCSLAYSMKYSLGYIVSEIEVIAKLIAMALVAAVLLDSPKKIRWFLIVIGISAGLLGAYYGVFGLFAGSQSISGPGKIGDNNNYAVLLVSILPIIFFSFRHADIPKDHNIRGIITLGLLFSIIVAVVLTFSRGGFIALVITVTLLLFNIRHVLTRIILWPIFFIVLSVIGWQLSSTDTNSWTIPTGVQSDSIAEKTVEKYLERINTLRINLEQESSAESRKHFWSVAFQMAKSKPVFGIGINRYPHDYSKYDFSNGEYGKVRAVHNLFLLVLSETGIAGFIVFMSIILSCLVLHSQTYRILPLLNEADQIELGDYIRMCRITLAGFLSASMFVSTLNQEVFWAIISVSLAIFQTAKNLQKDKQ